MILLYHKVDLENRTTWWVSADAFRRQMTQLAGRHVVGLDAYDPTDPRHTVITFDGIYAGVLRFAAPLLQELGYPFELFVSGAHVGQGNDFDASEPPSRFADRAELAALVSMGGRLQWHSHSHRDLSDVPVRELADELEVPDSLRALDPEGFSWFAYPYGRTNPELTAGVRERFRGGLMCDVGEQQDPALWPRLTVRESTALSQHRVSVVVPSYNYGQFLPEAVDSVLRQSYRPDEIVLSDDSSSDDSFFLMQALAEENPSLIRARRTASNLGIESHFNGAVAETSGDLLCFLGADNRFPGDYIEGCVRELFRDERAGIAYTDVALFGDRAADAFDRMRPDFRGAELHPGVFASEYPEFTAESRQEFLSGPSFIHGSSMYRREAWEAAGGYGSRESGPEDRNLFRRIVELGWDAVKVRGPLLEYRQHSPAQANQHFIYLRRIELLQKQVERLSSQLERRSGDLEAMRASRRWRYTEIAARAYSGLRRIARRDR